MWFVGLDVHSEATAVSMRSARGLIVLRTVVPTTAVALRRVLARARGSVTIACEAGPLASWLKNALETKRREVIVCDRRRTRVGTRGGSKSDRFDADQLSECLRTGAIHRVYVPQGPQLELRRLLLHYVRMVGERRRIKQRIRALFLESAVRLPARVELSRRAFLRSLPVGAPRQVARAYIRQLEVADELVTSARALLLTAAAANPAFALMQTIPQVGEIRAATLVGIIGTAARFGARRHFWSYGGLGVIQRVSSEHRVQNGQVVRESRTRGVRRSKAGQPLLRKVLSDIALHASVGRGALRTLFEEHVARGKRPAVARLALARKIASVVIAVWRSGEPYNASLILSRNKISGRASFPQLSQTGVTSL